MNQFGTLHPPVTTLVEAKALLEPLGWRLVEEHLAGDFYANYLHTHSHETASAILTLAGLKHYGCGNPDHIFVYL